ncbi:RTA1-domain-containing protein [Backusella circina FSU 941]|nr:RTA1-domain-containing protein [Backusella circina FSU 941]
MADSQNSVTNEAVLYFHYIPNLPLAIVGMAIFAVSAATLIWLTRRSNSPRYLYILPITALCEVIGYLLRAMCHSDTTLIKYIIQQMFLLLSPNALALVNYKTCGEIIRLSNVKARYFFLKPKFVTWFFFWSDIFAFFLQGSGGGLQASESSRQIGTSITLVGLYIQLFFFASFAVITVYVHKSSEYYYAIEGVENAKHSLIRTLYITILLLFIRAIYRVVEYQTGYSGPVASAEWAFYIFDGLVIALCFLAYIIPFIGNYLPKKHTRGKAFEFQDLA